jgi:hypothetical protein
VKLWMLGALAFALLSLFTLWQRAELRSTRLELRQASDALADSELREEAALRAAAIDREARAAMEAEAVRWAALARERSQMEGYDAPLPDGMRDAAGLVWQR